MNRQSWQGWDDDGKQAWGQWCAVFVWFQQFLLKSLCGEAAGGKAAGEGGVYFVPQHLHPGALLRSSTYFTATHMLGHD